MITKEDKVKQFLKDRSLCIDVGNENAACSIASINYALGKGFVEDVPETVSPVITHWLMLSQDIMSLETRDKKLKKLLPQLINTEDDKDEKRIKILRRWVFNVLPKALEEDMDDIGSLKHFKEALRLKSSPSIKKVRDSLDSNVYVYGDFFTLLDTIANDKDNIVVARKVGIIAGYAKHTNWLDKELIKLLKRMIKA